jgi:hypothetical protein
LLFEPREKVVKGIPGKVDFVVLVVDFVSRANGVSEGGGRSALAGNLCGDALIDFRREVRINEDRFFRLPQQCGSPDRTDQRFPRALNIEMGEIVWEVPQFGPAPNKIWTGVLATAGGLIFYGQRHGGFAAVDQRDGKPLWRFPTNVRMKASPMTFSAGGNQYVAVAAGPNILCFGL